MKTATRNGELLEIDRFRNRPTSRQDPVKRLSADYLEYPLEDFHA